MEPTTDLGANAQPTATAAKGPSRRRACGLVALGGALLALSLAAPTASAATIVTYDGVRCNGAYDDGQDIVCIGGKQCNFILIVGHADYYNPDPNAITGGLGEALFTYHRTWNCANSGVGSCTPQLGCIWVAYLGEGYGTPP